jgi:hypothetical protein
MAVLTADADAGAFDRACGLGNQRCRRADQYLMPRGLVAESACECAQFGQRRTEPVHLPVSG